MGILGMLYRLAQQSWNFFCMKRFLQIGDKVMKQCS